LCKGLKGEYSLNFPFIGEIEVRLAKVERRSQLGYDLEVGVECQRLSMKLFCTEAGPTVRPNVVDTSTRAWA
jgi:hypothetical protein